MGTSVSAILTAATTAAATVPPGAPTALVTSAVTTTGLTLSWTAPTVGLPVTYQPMYRQTGQTAWTSYPASGPITGTSIAITGLSPNTRYDFAVTAINSVTSTQSATVTATTAQVAPQAAVNPMAVATTTTTIHVSWTASPTPGVTYTVGYRTPTGSGAFTMFPTSTTTTSLDVTGLTQNTSYDFEVVSTNSAGSAPSTIVTAKTLSGQVAPGAPGTPTAGTITATSIQINWTVPTTGSGPFTNTIQYRNHGAATWATAGTTTDPTDTFTLTNLQSGTSYDFQVTAANNAGSGPASGMLTVSTSSSGAVRNPYLNPGGNTSFWVTPLGSGAVWSATGDADTQSLLSKIGTVNGSNYGMSVYVGQATDPLVTFTSTMGAGNQRDPNLTVTLHCPANAVPSPPYPGGDCQIVIFDPVTQPGKMYCYGGCSFNNGKDVTGGVTGGFAEVDLICGTMEDAVTGNYGYNSGVGVIRASDLDPAQSPNGIQHGLRFASDASQMLPPPDWTTASQNGVTYIYWPQTHTDYNAPTWYTGKLPAGATVGIPANVTMPSGLSAGGQMLWHCLQQYGAHWRDQSGGGITFYTTPDLDTNPLIQGMRGDMATICSYLRVLRNQGPNSVQGGGTPVVAGPPPVDPAVCGAPAAPGQVTGVTLTSDTPTSATLSWTAPSGTPPLKYIIEASVHAANSWTVSSPTLFAANGTISGLTAGGNYDFRVTASNSAGSGTPSATLTVQLPTQSTTAVTYDPAQLVGTVTLSNNNTTATAGTPAAGATNLARSTTAQSTGKWIAEFSADTVTNNFAVGLCDGTPTGTPGSFGGDAHSIAYYPITPLMSVWYNGAQLAGAYANQTPLGPGTKITIAVDLDAKLFWISDPAMRAAFGTSAWNDSASANPATGTGGCSFSGLTAPYYLAFNDDDAGGAATINGTSGFAIAIPSGFTPWIGSQATVTVPTAPTGVAATAITSGGFTVTWNAVTGTGGSVTYTVETSPHGANTWTVKGTAILTSLAVTGLSAATAYDVRVSAANSAGNGPTSTPISVTTAAAGSGPNPLVHAPLSGSVAAGQWQLAQINGMYYWSLAPANYDQTKSYPLILYLHPLDMGDGFYKNGNSPASDYVEPSIDPWFNNVTFRTNHPCFVLAPLLDMTSDESGNTINWGGVSANQQQGQINCVALVNYWMQTYPINPDYVFCTGNSMGGIGSWDMAIRYNKVSGLNGKIFSAFLILAGADYVYNYPNPTATMLQNLAPVPIFSIHGGQDTQVPLDWDQNMYQGLGGTTAYDGSRAAKGQMWYLQDGSLSHDVWDTYYVEPTAEAYWNWMFNTAPSVIGTVPGGSTGGGTPGGPPTLTESPNNTTVMPNTGGQIVDANLAVYTITAGAQVAINGTADASTSSVAELAYVNHVVWYATTAGLWRSWSGSAWTPTAGTTTSPLPSAGGLTPAGLVSYLRSISGSHSISGQYLEFGPLDSVNTIHTRSGKWVGMIGINYWYDGDTSQSANTSANTYAQQWWSNGGLVMVNLFMPNPTTGGSERDTSSLDAAGIVQSGTATNTRFNALLDSVAAGLAALQSAGVVVLLRPFLENNGNWFWWCANMMSASQFIAMWRYAYNRIVNTKGIKNCAWVYAINAGFAINGRTMADTYPGDAYVDVTGQDLYTSDATQGGGTYDTLLSVAPNKPTILAEYGPGSAGQGDANFDETLLISAIKNRMPKVCLWQQWWSAGGYNWGLDVTQNTTAALGDAWVVNRGDMSAFFNQTGGGGGGGGTPATPTVLTPTSGGSLTDSSGNTWTMGTDGTVYENGTAIPGSAGTAQFTISNGQYYGQDGSTGQWYTYSPSTQQWTAASAPF